MNKRWVVAVLACGMARVVAANVVLPALFGDHMVVQQGKPVIVWGKAEPGEAVTATLAGRSAKGQAGEDGHFRLQLPALDAHADAGPQELVVTGRNTVRYRDVLVGEVWLCSGQSNMRLTVRECGALEPGEAEFKDIRLFLVPDSDATSVQFTTPSKWSLCANRSVMSFSAAAFHFARELHQALKVPVGVIDTSRGWSPAEAWVPLKLLDSNPQTRPLADRHRALSPRFDELEKAYQEQLAAWKQEQRAATRPSLARPQPGASPVAATQPAQPRPRRPWGVDRRLRPEGLYNAMLAPLSPVPLAGVAWYQGESNALRAQQYETLLPMLIARWRELFEQPSLPFGIVQLPGHVNRDIPFDGSWAELREAQLRTHRTVAHTGLIVTVDIGEPHNIHPVNKKDVGKRLAAWALADVYKRPGEATGPLFKSASVEGGAMRIRFDHVGKGLASVKNGPLTAFTIAGKDRAFHPATARIEKDTLVVSSPEVPSPLAVRYGWSDRTDMPACNLMNADGLLASPFRTDDWPLQTDGVLTVEWQ